MAILNTHNHPALAFGILGNVISFMVYLAPLPTFYRIYKRKSTEGFQSLPYLVALFSSMLWLYYASLKPADATLLITINSVGCVIEIVYIVMFTIYATRDAKNLTVKLFMAMNVGSFASIFLVTYFAIHGSLRVQIVGWICVTISVCVFAAPLSIVAQVIRTKNVEFMPIILSVFLTLSAVMWFLYGISLKDICIAFRCCCMAFTGIVEERRAGAEQALEPMTNVVVVNPLGNSEVYPVPVIDEESEQGIIKGAEEEDKGAEIAEIPA
ncbi:Bidirectional sugar transporter N3 [Spatholobus suberectus]|nr:Bidirectional sugar transporter N3 [Spatholobus suberectus]